MKVKEGFVLGELGEQTIVIPVGAASNDFNGMVKLNDTGKFLWEKLQNEVTEQELAAALVEKYGIDAERATADVQDFIATLKKPGIVE